jgi:hypothetical protein
MATHPDAVPFTAAELDTVLSALEMYEAQAQHNVNTDPTPEDIAALRAAQAAHFRAVALYNFAHR